MMDMNELLKLMEEKLEKETPEDSKFNELLNRFDEVRSEYLKELAELRAEYQVEFVNILSEMSYVLESTH